MKKESVMCMDIHITHNCSSKNGMHQRRPDIIRHRQQMALYPDVQEPGRRGRSDLYDANTTWL